MKNFKERFFSKKNNTYTSKDSKFDSDTYRWLDQIYSSLSFLKDQINENENKS